MPFEVSPSKSVDIDWSQAGPDDALRVTTTEPFTLFCTLRREDHYTRLVLIPEAVPSLVRKAAVKAAREFIAGVSEHRDKEFSAWLDEQPDAAKGLRSVVADRMLRAATVVATRGRAQEPLDIGTTVGVRFSNTSVVSQQVDSHFRPDAGWFAPGEVQYIRPATRFEAIKWAAARY